MNLPHGVTTRDIDNLCRPTDNDFPNRVECVLCKREMEQDDSTRRWFDAEDIAAFGMTYCLTFSNALDVFEMQGGLCCGAACYNDRAIEAEESSTRIHLVGGAA